MQSKISSSRISFEPSEDIRRSTGSFHHDSAMSVEATVEDRAVYDAWREAHPCVLEHFDEVVAAAAGKLVAIFLDYDGTLTPIVNNPDAAYMSEHMREAVRSVARLFPTAIISGRGREKVQQFVQLKELFYAGSHGMDIAGPQITSSFNNTDGDCNGSTDEEHNNNTMDLFQPAAQYESTMNQLSDELWEGVKSIPGASVENNKFCVSVHFRNCLPTDYDAVAAAVDTIMSQHQDLHVTRGRKVLEIRPKLDWNKGSALLHLVKMLQIEEKDVYCLYIGDDRTDEDAFQALYETGTGAGILVSTKKKETSGRWTLRDPTEVAMFLNKIVAWGHSDANLWHRKRSCHGWRLIANSSTQSAEALKAFGAAGNSGQSGHSSVATKLSHSLVHEVKNGSSP